MRVEIVSHCYSVRMREYAHYLNYQLSSLVLHKPQCEISTCVCIDSTDAYTLKFIDWFKENTDLNIRVLSLSTDQMSWRAIGRNEAALSTKADIVWFSDCDQVYRDGVLDKLSEREWPENKTLIYPHRVMINTNYEYGDRSVENIKEPCLVDIDTKEFKMRGYRKPIGGVQIVKGDHAREHGYLKDNEKYMVPFGKPFDKHCRDDTIYRKQTGDEFIQAIRLPGVYRMRHTECGVGD